jgi:hypothetical protein
MDRGMNDTGQPVAKSSNLASLLAENQNCGVEQKDCHESANKD